jgi:hypothetical protein
VESEGAVSMDSWKLESDGQEVVVLQWRCKGLPEFYKSLHVLFHIQVC